MRNMTAIALILVGTMHAQSPDPALADWQAAVAAAEQAGDTEATVGRLTGADDRVVLCALDGAFTRLRCFHSTQRMIDGVLHVVHSEPNDYDGVALADILAAERAWVDGG